MTASEISERPVIYSMGAVSLDGLIAGPDGDIGWGEPDEELFRFHTEQMREVGVQLCGRRLYETMLYWEMPEEELPGPLHVEWARVWRPVPKLVFSTTLEAVAGNATLARRGVAEEVAELKRQPGKAIAVGGAGLASALIALDLVDEYRLFLSPVVLGGGTPYFPALERRIDLELVQTRTFGSRVVYVRYRRR
ncbi:MAG TPA: dihydrofolate reductase family protein [Solirubrobacteraceae bacterium]|nr:dihydrofolate reductase family protein [Solirubrobacteraceae bacterium]